MSKQLPSHSQHSTPDENWIAFAQSRGLTLPRRPSVNGPGSASQLDIEGDRDAQHIHEGEWQTSHRLKEIGYETRDESISVPKTADHTSNEKVEIGVKIYRPTHAASTSSEFPLLFVTHGGGWIQGTHVTEEAWLLWPLLTSSSSPDLRSDFVIVSVDYRLVPEWPFETVFSDCWHALLNVASRSRELGFDPEQVIVGGSSAGACLAAGLAQKARDSAEIHVSGVLLNVPITCDPRHFPHGLQTSAGEEYEFNSYETCTAENTLMLHAGEMRQIWDIVVPDGQKGKSPVISPLLGDLRDLPPHLIYVAGQDPLRDEGIAYANKLRDAGGEVVLRIYSGVPHTFGEIWELEKTKTWWQDLRRDVKGLLT